MENNKNDNNHCINCGKVVDKFSIVCDICLEESVDDYDDYSEDSWP